MHTGCSLALNLPIVVLVHILHRLKSWGQILTMAAIILREDEMEIKRTLRKEVNLGGVRRYKGSSTSSGLW